MEDGCVRIFVGGAVSDVGKTTFCLGLLVHLKKKTDSLAYIKPATQCEAPDLLARWCSENKVRHVGGSQAPLVFYPGLTRAVISGEATVDVEEIAAKVDEVCAGKRYCVVDGVGFPGVGSCVGASNADIARACRAPVVLVGKAGVGSAIDTHCLDAALFEKEGVPVLGAVFNKADNQGFYSKEKIIGPIETFFSEKRPRETCYGIVPTREGGVEDDVEQLLSHLDSHVDFHSVVRDAELDVFNRKRRKKRRRSVREGGEPEERSRIETKSRADGAPLTSS